MHLPSFYKSCFFIGLWLASVSYSHAQKPPLLFQEQVAASCLLAPTYHKIVTDLTKAEQTGEKKSQVLSQDSANCPLSRQELNYAFDRYYASARMAEFFEIEEKGDTIHATIKKGKESAASLQEQKILLSADGKTLLYVLAHQQQNYWLFKTESRIEVFFDAQGRYLRHNLYLRDKVPLVGRKVEAMIKGEAEY